MRIHNSELIHSRNSILLLRHGTDSQVLQSDLNPPLDPAHLNEFKELAREGVWLCKEKRKIRLICSNRLRAQQSAELFIQELGPDRLVEFSISELIREIDHGSFRVIDHQAGERYQPLVDAWSLWAEALEEMDVEYRYGDPVRKGEIKFQSLSGIFTRFGENHREFTIRIYTFLAHLIEKHHSDDSVFTIVLAHQATLSRIQRLLDVLSSLESLPSPGKLMRELERNGNRINIDESCGVVVRCPPLELPFQALLQEVRCLEPK